MSEWDHAIRILQDHGKSILIGMVMGMCCAAIVMFIQKPVWEAKMIVAPASQPGMPSMANFLPKMGAGAPVLQYFVERIDAAGGSDFSAFETLITSPRLADALEQSGALTPSSGPMAKWLKDHVRVRSVGMTPFREITLRHTDKQAAATLLDMLYRKTDMMIRQDAKTKTNRRITYLKEQLKTVRNPDHRDAMVALLKEQEQTAMMVSIDTAFAARTIDGASVGYKPVAPDWRLLFPVFIFAGGIFGFMLSGLREALQKP